MQSTMHVSNPGDVGMVTESGGTIREEGFLHWIAREGRVALRWVIGLAFVATVICMMSFFMFAMIPAIIMLGAYILLLLANEVERRSDVEAHDATEHTDVAGASDIVDDHAEDDQLHPMDAAIVKRESKTGVAILGAVAVAAVLIAASFLEWRVVAIGALVVFAYMLLLAAPLWLGWFNDDVESAASQQLQPEANEDGSATAA